MLVIEKLSFSFPGRTILDGVSVQLRTHAVTCLLGGNGSGKTTLLNLITGFLRPDAGSIRLGETELTHRAPFRISRMGVARTFQDLRLIGKLSVRENILLALTRPADERLVRALLPMGARAFCHSSAIEEKAGVRSRNESPISTADTLLAEYFLTEVAAQPASEISYGQQKLLTLACCAAMDANLLLLDEPVAGISPEYRERIAERLASLKSAGKTILLIEHQPDFLERVGERFLFLEAGRMHAFDTFTELTAAPVTHEALHWMAR
jgi:branched-chain amino acid transport system ATP-binding protein